VLTFDDGPLADHTSVLKTLADECTKAVFFRSGLQHHLSSGDSQTGLRRRPHRRSHTWSHAHLDSKKMTEAQAKEEIEKGL